MSNNNDIEILKTELVGLKIRLGRVEDFLRDFPIISDYLEDNKLEDEELFDEAKKIIVEYDKVSVSLLQQTLSIGYVRAAKLLELLLERKCVKQSNDPNEPMIVLLDKNE